MKYKSLVNTIATPLALAATLACSGQQNPVGDGDAGGAAGGNGLSSNSSTINGTTNNDSTGNVMFVVDTMSKSGKWSNPTTWPGGKLPVEGDDVLIPANASVILDVSPPALGNVMLDGELIFDDQDLEFSAKMVMVHGKLEVGTETKPIEHNIVITLTGDNPTDDLMGMGNRGIGVMDSGTIELHGSVDGPLWTQLGDHAPAAATELTLKESVSWKVGDQVVISPTDFFKKGRSEAFALSAVKGTNVQLDGKLENARWGVLQYITDKGPSLSPAESGLNEVLDERAEVANLTRKIKIQGPDDAVWQTDGFGAHIMIMGDATAHIEGVELSRVGQAGILARYPLHFHRQSYDDDGQELGDREGQYVKDSAIWNSAQRCVVIHATNGLTIEGNVCYDIKGHAFFLEDGVERRNVFSNNLALHIREPDKGKLLRDHEHVSFRRGPAGFWLTNPDNILTNNVAADSEGIGFWLAFGAAPLGSSTNVPVIPLNTPFGLFDGAVTHSNNVLGLVFDFAPVDDAGTTVETQYYPTVDGTANGAKLPFTISGITSYKGGESGGSPLWNRSAHGTYTKFKVADFTGHGFQGASVDCTITKNIVVGTSLNNASGALDDTAQVGVASYHSECDITNNVFVNLPYVEGQPSGAFATGDYYIRPVDRGLVRNVDNTLINTHPGYRIPSPNVTGSDNFALAGALWDPFGNWGSPKNYWVYDLPYLTDGQKCSPAPGSGNGMSCPGPYYGVSGLHMDSSTDDYLPLEFTRILQNGDEADWLIPDGRKAQFLGNMRHGAAALGGTYTMRTVDVVPQRIEWLIENLMTKDDWFIVGWPYGGNSAPGTVYGTSWDNPGEATQWDSYKAFKKGDSSWKTKFRGEFLVPLTPVDSMAEVESSSGNVYFHDAAKKMVWLKCVGGLTAIEDPNAAKFSNQTLYQAVHYVIDAQSL